ncbi:MAG: glycosyltransferase family 2 protein [Candidatus Zixiibacteriota bacterium]|nr:MAG: glycosyltransferase family 2 protein [candidate division Zixibacteria bacterium]
MDLSVIIVNYKTKDLLDRCLQSLLRSTQAAEFEIIVIDNNSRDGSIHMLEKEYPQVTLIKNQENLGFAKACNQGIRIAEGKYVFILNPDTLIEDNTLANIIDFMESNPKVGIGGCHIYSRRGKPQSCFYKFPTLLSYFSRMLSLFRILPRSRLTQEFFWEYPDDNIARPVDRVLGAAMVLRKEAVEQIGLFDERYFMYAEELDLCYRARQGGWEVYPIPDTEVIHYHQQSSLQNVRKTTFHTFKSDFLFFKKFFPQHKVALLRLMQFCAISLRLMTWSAVYLFSSTKRTFAKEKLFGYVKLLLSNFDYSESILK